jgi:hypothetical protein
MVAIEQAAYDLMDEKGILQRNSHLRTALKVGRTVDALQFCKDFVLGVNTHWVARSIAIWHTVRDVVEVDLAPADD